MSAAAAIHDFPSPESTVTSLLGTSGHIRSSLLPQLNTTIRYGDKDYESASEALNAYIADYDRSLCDGQSSTARLVLPPSPSSTPFRPRPALRNRDVLSERLTDGELDFLSLPVNSGRHHGNRDRLTMTTEELLAIPCDGSLPVTHTSARLVNSGAYSLERSGLLSLSGAFPRERIYPDLPGWASCEPRCKAESLRYPHTPCPHRSGSHRVDRTSRPLQPRARGGAAVPQSSASRLRATKQTISKTRESETASAGPGDALSPFHYPRWFTSQKSDMDVSGISSVPNMKYPGWVEDCDAAAQDPCHHTAVDPGLLYAPVPEPRSPSWLGELADADDELQKQPEGTNTQQEGGSLSERLLGGQLDPQQSLRELRLQLAEKITLTSGQREDSPVGLESLFQVGCNKDPARSEPEQDPVLWKKALPLSPGNTEELLDAEHCWDNPPVAFKSHVPLGGARVPEISPDTLLTHGRQEASGSCPWGSSIGKHPGPVEALKQMLFSLQAIEEKLERQQQQQQTSALSSICSAKLQDDPPVKQTAEAEPPLEDIESAPEGESLHRALHHLVKLKRLVEKPPDKQSTANDGETHTEGHTGSRGEPEGEK